jgi:CHAT domain-containing protein
MGRIWARLLVGAFCLALPASPILAQPTTKDRNEQQRAIEFRRLYERWQKSKDPDEKGKLAEQALGIEPTLGSWPLSETRDHVKGRLRFGLGYAYYQSHEGVRANNLENAIENYEAALAVLAPDSQLWAGTHNNLAAAYNNRIRGDRADNLEKAIGHTEAALKTFTREAFPERWADARNNLAATYSNRIRGDRADNLEKAIGHFEAALTVFVQEAFPRQWMVTQSNLGVAYSDRIRGDRADNLEKAIASYVAALAIGTRRAFPQEWAQLQNNLGAAYSDRLRGDRSDNLEKAIALYQAALTVRSQKTSPQDWAQTQSNLGNAYSNRIRGDRPDNLKKAIAHYEAALAVRTLQTLPREHLSSARELGSVLVELKQWKRAGLLYESAREAFLLLFGQGLNEAEARDLISEAGPLFAEAALAATERGEADTALALVGEGRARLLAVALRLQTLELSDANRKRLDELRAAIREEQHEAEAAQGADRAAAIDKLVLLRSALLDLTKNVSAATGNPKSVLEQVRPFVIGGGAIVAPIVTKMGSKILTVTASRPGPSVLDLPELTSERLNELIRGEGKNGGWLGAYRINYLPQEDLKRRWPEWQTAITNLGPELWRLFGARLGAALNEQGVGSGERLFWLPTGALGILPLGLVQNPSNRRYLSDDHEIVYIPSLEALTWSQRQIARTSPTTLAVIVNPTGDLPGTEKEGNLVGSHFPTDARTLLVGDAAVPDAVLAAIKGKSHWHFASHGMFSWDDARQSALIMHGQTKLNVGRLLDTPGLGRPRLVVLSACETGLYDINRNPDEFIGLPGAFVALGAAGVLGTLWPVSDGATALLIGRFYELHMGQGLAPPTALRKAQDWLRRATNVDLQAYARVAASQGRLESRQLREIEQELSEEGLRRSRNNAIIEWDTPYGSPGEGTNRSVNADRIARPYAHPYFWAGFIHTGQ